MIYALGLLGVAVFSITGVLEAGRRSIDLFGVVVIAMAAALGGGTLRDLLLDRPVFWVMDEIYIVSAMGAGVLTFAVARIVRLPANLFLIPDCARAGVVHRSRTLAPMALIFLARLAGIHWHITLPRFSAK